MTDPAGAPSELDKLAGQAASVDAEARGDAPAGETKAPGAGAAPNAEPETIPTAAQLEGLLTMAIAKTSENFPELAALWTKEKIEAFCGALGPLLDKYGMDAFGFMEQWRVEIMAAVVCLPLLWETVKIVRLKLESEQRKKEKEINPRGAAGFVDPHAPPRSGPNAPPAS